MQTKDFPYLFFSLRRSLGVGGFFTVSLVACFLLIPIITSAGIIPQPPNNLGLVGYWSFEGTQDTSVDDYSGNGNTGTMTNMDAGSDYVSGYKTGSTALDFDGSDDYLDVGGPSQYLTTSQFTISTWVKADSLTGSTENTIFIIDQVAGSGNSPIALEYSVRTFIDGATGFHIGSYNGSSWSGAATGDAVNTGEWYHLVANYDGSNFNLYVNGVLERSASGTYTNSGGRVGTIGSNFTYDGGYTPFRAWDGLIDDFRLYNRALSASEVSLLYNGRKAIYQSNDKTSLVGYWSFEDATGTKATDFSGSGNTGTLTNMDSSSDWVDGKVGKALDFDGVDDYVDTNTTYQFGTDSFSVSAWVYARGGAGRDVLMINRGGDEWIFAISSTVFQGYIYDTETGEDSGSVNSPTIAKNEWVLATMVVDRDNDLMTFYANGVAGTPKDISNITGTIDPTNDAWIGHNTSGSGVWDPGWFDGKMDELRIYNSALTATQVQNLYNNSKYTQINTPQNDKLTDGLVGYWTFNGQDVTSATVLDVSGNGNNGTRTNGPTTAIGKIGQAMSFDDVDDYISIGNPTSLNFDDTSFAISAWFKLEADDTQFSTIAGKWDESGGKRQYWATFNSSGQAQLRVGTGGSGEGLTATSPLGYDDGVWHLYVGVYNKATDTSTVYIDGVSVATASPGVTLGSSTATLYLGKTESVGGVSNLFFDGELDEVRIYNRTLTTTEITRLYNLGR